MRWVVYFFFNDTATTEIYTLSLHDALPISGRPTGWEARRPAASPPRRPGAGRRPPWPHCRRPDGSGAGTRSEEHTSELQSRQYLVCRLLLEKKKKQLLHYLVYCITNTVMYT